MKKILLILLFLFFGSQVFAEPLQKCKLKVGWENWFPYIYLGNGQMMGAEYSYLREIAAMAGCSLIFIDQPWSRSLKNLENASLDMLYGASFTDEREVFSQFSNPYRYETFVLVTNDNLIPDKVTIKEWLAKKDKERSQRVLGLIIGFYYGEILDPILRNPSATHIKHEVTSDDLLLEMVNKKRIDGFVVEKVVGDEMLISRPNLKLSIIRESKREPMHLMFSLKISSEIVNLFNRAIGDLPEE